MGDLIDGKILQLESERLREEGQKTERVRAIQNMISLGLTKEKILTKYSGLRTSENAGYGNSSSGVLSQITLCTSSTPDNPATTEQFPFSNRCTYAEVRNMR